ncbi:MULTISPECIES: SUKH-3 domain-containing protein [unclassified Streptomyces]|uniref:SUKH-3 domain-containing protein n=1 Tax=unclassified Streptomyces TaxID=2593676 RepID=UPI002E2E2908|nr:SUKH-3 domain-containing protein [Streptomyces sp. NBC_00334]
MTAVAGRPAGVRGPGEGRFPPDVAAVLSAAGWFEGVRVDDGDMLHWFRALKTAGADMSPPAVAALREFGGLTVHQYGPGVDMSRMPFRIDPMAGVHASATLAAYGAALGSALTPLGEYDLGRGRLAMDEEGAVHLWWGDLWRVAHSMDTALSALVRGRRPTRLDLEAPREPPPEHSMDVDEATVLARRLTAWNRTDVGVALHPFDLGWLVHHPPSPAGGDTDAPARDPGGGYWVIDRRNGRVTSWPSVPPDVVVGMYRDQHGDHPPRHAVRGGGA